MTKVVFDLALYSTTQPEELATCPWREWLKSQPRQWKDLNYGNCDEAGLQAAIDPLNGWVSPEILTTQDFPFIVYQWAAENSPPTVVLIRTIDELNQDPILNAA